MKKEIDLILNKMDEYKGEDMLFVDMDDANHPISDYIIVISARNDVHLNGLVNALLTYYKQHKHGDLKGLDYIGVSGKAESQWVILDFNDVLVHIMDQGIRQAYAFDDLFESHHCYRYH